MTEGIAEILERISKIEDEKERAEALRKSGKEYPGVFQCLGHAFHPEVRWDLPQGDPPYKKNDKAMDLQGMLHGRIRTFEYFVKGNHPNVKPHKREQIFIQLLETVDPDDAELLLMIKDKRVRYNKRITRRIFQMAFPEETKDW